MRQLTMGFVGMVSEEGRARVSWAPNLDPGVCGGLWLDGAGGDELT